MTRLLPILLLAAACCGCTQKPVTHTTRILAVGVDSVASSGDSLCAVVYVARDSIGRIIIYNRTFISHNFVTRHGDSREMRAAYGDDASAYAIRYADSLRKLMVIR